MTIPAALALSKSIFHKILKYLGVYQKYTYFIYPKSV